MKTWIGTTLCLFLTVGHLAAGSKERDMLTGGLIGAAVGAIVGHSSHDIDTAVAIPAFAVLGALAGYGHNQGWYDYDGWYAPYDPWYDGRGYYGDWRDRDYRYRGMRRYRAPRAANRPPSGHAVKARKAVPSAAANNLHPGVTIVVIPVKMANGVTLDLRLLKVNERFIGPRGEAYESQPTPEMLAAAYLP